MGLSGAFNFPVQTRYQALIEIDNHLSDDLGIGLKFGFSRDGVNPGVLKNWYCRAIVPAQLLLRERPQRPRAAW